MAQVRKFLFNVEFAPDGSILRDAAKRLSSEEVEAERLSAYENGKNDALVQAERASAAQLQILADAAVAIVARLDAESRGMREEAARIAMIAARKIAGAALDAYGAEHAAAAIEAAMDTLRHQPRLMVKLAPETAATLRPRIEELRTKHDYAGVLLVRPEPSMGAGEVAIDWSDGVVSLNPEEAAERIDGLVKTALASATATQ